MKKKEIKNWLTLIAIFIIAMSLTLYVCKCYKVFIEYEKEKPVIADAFYEISSEDEVYNYIMENPTTTLYMCIASDDTCRSYERGLKKLSKKIDLSESVVYLNLNDVDQDEFIEKFNKKYVYKIPLKKSFPAFVTFEDGKIIGILQGTDKEKLTISKTRQYMEFNHIVE